MSNLKDEWGFFVAIPESIIPMWTKIGTNAIAMFLYLRYRTNKKRGLAFPAVKTIRKDIGWSLNRIQKAIEALEEHELLERKKRFGQSTEYILKRPPDVGGIEEKPPSIRETGILDESDASIRETVTSVLEKRKKVLKTESTQTKEQVHANNETIRARAPSKKDQVRSALEIYFSKITKLELPKRETMKQKRSAASLWWGPLREIAELCDWDEDKAIVLIKSIVEHMREEELTIASPKSILNPARAKAAEDKSEPRRSFLSKEYR